MVWGKKQICRYEKKELSALKPSILHGAQKSEGSSHVVREEIRPQHKTSSCSVVRVRQTSRQHGSVRDRESFDQGN